MNRNQILVAVFAFPLFLLGVYQAAYGQSFPISQDKAVWKIEKTFQMQSIEYRWLHTADSVLVNDILYYRLGQKSAEISETDFTSAGKIGYRYYVDSARVDSGDGLNWARAFSTVQEALAKVKPR